MAGGMHLNSAEKQAGKASSKQDGGAWIQREKIDLARRGLEPPQ
jgi:hypothetical protein